MTLPISALSPAVKALSKSVIKMPPTMGPAQWRLPPSTLMSTTVKGTVMLKVSPTVTYDTYKAWMAPMTPAKKLESAKAPILSQKVGTPLTSAASSSSWMAKRPRPARAWNSHQAAAMAAASAAAGAQGRTLDARDCLRVLMRSHFEVLLGPQSDFIPVMLYEWRLLSAAQRSAVNDLKAAYEAVWVPVLGALHDSGALRGDPVLARLFIFGAINWAAQSFDPKRRASLYDLTETALQLFLKD